MVHQVALAVRKKQGARFLLMGDDLRNHGGKPPDDLIFALSECTLVGDLVKIAESLAALPVKATHREPQLVDSLHDSLNLIRQYKPRQVEHDRRTHSGAEIRRAGGQITECFIESKRKLH